MSCEAAEGLPGAVVDVDRCAQVRSVAFTPYSEFTTTTALIGPNCLDAAVAQNRGLAAVMINPYPDAESISRAATYCWGTSLELCHRLAHVLGPLVRESHSDRYWERLLLPWTTLWVEQVYDRYLRLCRVRERYPQAWLELPALGKTPQYQRTSDVTGWAHTHPISVRLYTELIDGMGLRERVRHIELSEPVVTNAVQPSHRSWPLRARYLLHRWLGLSQYRDANLEWFEATDITVDDAGFRAEPADRTRLSIEPLPDEFGGLVAAMAPQALPVSLVEEYPDRRRYAMKLIAEKRMRAVFVPHTAVLHDSIKYVTAECQERGAPVVSRQHGHAYGTLDTFSFEWLERRLADRFLTWGWADDHGDAVALPDPWLTPPRPGEKHPGRHVLYVMTEGRMYMNGYFHQAMPDTVLTTYFPWQEVFFAELPDATRNRILIRPYPHEYSSGGRQRIARMAPGIRLEGPQRARESLLSSRLVVVDHPGTSMLEALAWDVPVVAFWDPQRIPLRRSAAAQYDSLRAAGILHDSPQTAARHVTAVADDPRAWWDHPDVKAVRQAFCREFAWGSADWPKKWQDALGPLVGVARRRAGKAAS